MTQLNTSPRGNYVPIGSREELKRIRYNARLKEYKHRNKEAYNQRRRELYRMSKGLSEEDVERNKKERANYARKFFIEAHSQVSNMRKEDSK